MSLSKKIVLLGHFGVGKTSLIQRFVHDTFSETYKVSIGVSVSKKIVHLDTLGDISLILWDIEGTDDLRKIRTSYLLGSHGFYYVFDVNRPSTFKNMNNDLQLLQELAPDCPIQIVGNKKDLLNDENASERRELEHLNYNFLTSAKTGEKVEDSFIVMAKELSGES